MLYLVQWAEYNIPSDMAVTCYNKNPWSKLSLDQTYWEQNKNNSTDSYKTRQYSNQFKTKQNLKPLLASIINKGTKSVFTYDWSSSLLQYTLAVDKLSQPQADGTAHRTLSPIGR